MKVRGGKDPSRVLGPRERRLTKSRKLFTQSDCNARGKKQTGMGEGEVQSTRNDSRTLNIQTHPGAIPKRENKNTYP